MCVLLFCLLSLLCVLTHGQQLPTINRTTQGVVSTHTYEDATSEDDSKVARFARNIVQPLTVQIVKDTFQSSGDDNHISYQRLRFAGAGTFWQAKFGVPGVWIDLRRSVRGSYASGAPDSAGRPTATGKDYAGAEVIYTEDQEITFNITYINTLPDSYDIVHAHGITARDWRTDGVAFISDMPMAPMEPRKYTYTIPWNNSGTYFMHSHWSFNALAGVTAPLVIVTDAPSGYPNKTILDDDETVDALLFLEDWCLQMTDADDAENGNKLFDSNIHREPFVCQNPMLSFRAMWGEWNSDPAKKLNQSRDLDRRENGIEFPQCEETIDGFEFDFAYFLANGREYRDAVARKFQGGENVRLRIINAGSLTTYRVIIPDTILGATVIAVDGHYIHPAALPTNNTLWIAVGQRLDVLFTIPNTNGTYVIKAVQETPNPAETSKGNNASDIAEVSDPRYSGIALFRGDSATIDPVPDIPATPGLLAKHPEIIIQQEFAWRAWGEGLNWTMEEADRTHVLDLNGYNGIRGINGKNWILPPINPIYKSDPHPFDVISGQRVCLRIRNWDHEIHPIHLHGHTFQVMAIDDMVIPKGGAWRDTVQVPVCRNVTVCFNAVAAPDSIHHIHCHMLIHEMSGMQATIQYEKYSSSSVPYTYTGALDAYTRKFIIISNTGGNNIVNNVSNTNIINNNYDSNTSELTKTGLGVGLALGLALLLSWIFFGCAFFRYSQQHHYRPNMTADGRPSVSAPAGKQPAGMPNVHHELEEISQSQQ